MRMPRGLLNSLERLGVQPTEVSSEEMSRYLRQGIPEYVAQLALGWDWPGVREATFHHRRAKLIQGMVGKDDESGEDVALLEDIKFDFPPSSLDATSEWIDYSNDPAVSFAMALPMILLLRWNPNSKEPAVVAVNPFPEMAPELPRLVELGSCTNFFMSLDRAVDPTLNAIDIASLPEPDWQQVTMQIAERAGQYLGTCCVGDTSDPILTIVICVDEAVLSVGIEIQSYREPPQRHSRPAAGYATDEWTPDYYIHDDAHLGQLWDSDALYAATQQPLKEQLNAWPPGDPRRKVITEALHQLAERDHNQQLQAVHRAAHLLVDGGFLSSVTLAQGAFLGYAVHDTIRFKPMFVYEDGRWRPLPVEPIVWPR